MLFGALFRKHHREFPDQREIATGLILENDSSVAECGAFAVLCERAEFPFRFEQQVSAMHPSQVCLPRIFALLTLLHLWGVGQALHAQDLPSRTAAAELSVYDPLALPAERLSKPIEASIRDASRDREIPILIYMPTSRDASPVVLFSHGLGGNRNGSAYLGKHWAARGFVAVFLQHPGSDSEVLREAPLLRKASALREAASAKNFLARVRDVPVVLDQLQRWTEGQEASPSEAGKQVVGRLDLKRVGMSGHSFGAVTTQAVSGQRFPLGVTYTEPRIRAAILFSPSEPARGSADHAFGNVAIPWLLMTGTRDVARLGGSTIGPATVDKRLSVFPALLAGSKYEMVLDGAEHSAFTERALPGESGDRNPNHHRAILALSTAFWDAYLKEDGAARAWLDGDGPQRVLEAKDRWQTK
jgi:predicted dienelactone hydrolase